MTLNKKKKIQLISEYFTDGFSLAFGTGFAYLIFDVIINRIPTFSRTEWYQYVFLLFVAFSTVFITFSASINLHKRSRMHELMSIVRNVALTFMIFAVFLILFKNPIIESRYLFLGSCGIYFLLLCLNRYFLKRYLIHRFSDSNYATLAAIVTIEDNAEEFITALQSDWSKQFVGIAVAESHHSRTFNHILTDDLTYSKNGTSTATINKTLTSTDKEICGIPVVANLENFMSWVRRSSIDEVFINIPEMEETDLRPYVEELEDMGVTVHINLHLLENLTKDSKFDNIKCDITNGYPIATFSPTNHNTSALAFKRFMDITGGLIGIILSLPVILITAIPLLIESPGPLFFKQQRVGKNGRLFNIFKLRSMYTDAEERKQELLNENKMSGLMFKMDDDPRITKVGKFIRKTSIDEIPQFFNVLRGDMSLIGTRPPTIDEFEQYESHHKRRLSMRPGMSGMWQVSGRSEIVDFEEIVELDCKYIDEWSLALDIRLIFKTLGVVLGRKGAE